MVQLEAARSANKALVSKQALVAVFVGGTSGIGEYALRALAELASQDNSGQKLRAYIVGRNSSTAEKIITYCRKKHPKGQFKFVRAKDLSLMSQVDKCCDNIRAAEEAEAKDGRGPARVDVLVMSQGDLDFGGRRETPEGLDISTSLLYYSRMRFITRLLPLLTTSTLPTGSRCISIFAGGLEKKDSFFPEDLSMRDPKHYGGISRRSHVTYMTTLFFERLARENPGKLSCTHMFPSLVITPAFHQKGLPWWFRVIWFLAYPIARWFSVSTDEIAQRVLFLATERYPARETKATLPGELSVASATDGEIGGGAYSVKYDGETNDLTKAYSGLSLSREDLSQRVWEHTTKAFEEIDAGRAFKE